MPEKLLYALAAILLEFAFGGGILAGLVQGQPCRELQIPQHMVGGVRNQGESWEAH